MMDGKDITDTAVDGSTIHITSVTGNIIITVTTTGSEPQPSLLYNWDLTKSLTDTISNNEALIVGDTENTTISESGLTLSTSANAGVLFTCDPANKKIEYDIGECAKTGGTSRAFVFGQSNAETLSVGFLYRSTGHWAPYGVSGWGEDTEYTDSQMLNNATLTIEIDNNYNAKIIFNDEVVNTITLGPNIGRFGFGSKSTSWKGAIIKAVRVYQM